MPASSSDIFSVSTNRNDTFEGADVKISSVADYTFNNGKKMAVEISGKGDGSLSLTIKVPTANKVFKPQLKASIGLEDGSWYGVAGASAGVGDVVKAVTGRITEGFGVNSAVSRGAERFSSVFSVVDLTGSFSIGVYGKNWQDVHSFTDLMSYGEGVRAQFEWGYKAKVASETFNGKVEFASPNTYNFDLNFVSLGGWAREKKLAYLGTWGDDSAPVRLMINGSVGLANAVDSAWDSGVSLYNKFSSIFAPPKDPLIIDLGGDGLTLTSLAGSTTFFDLDLDGFAERTGWAGPNEGILALDLNQDGIINDASELFGNASLDAFVALRQHDLNNDGVIDASDAIFSDLLIWRDQNQDGISQASEIMSASAAGIVSISTKNVGGAIVENGNLITSHSSVLMSDGKVRVASAVSFATDGSTTSYTLPSNFQIDPDVFSLPNLKGFGSNPDLWIAMSLDPVLKAMVQDLVGDSNTFTGLASVVGGFSGFAYTTSTFEDMLARWAGVDPVLSGTAKVKAITADFLGVNVSSIPTNSTFLNEFKAMSAEMALGFYSQIPKIGYDTALKNAFDAITQMTASMDDATAWGAEVNAIISDIFSDVTLVDTTEELDMLAFMAYDIGTGQMTGDIRGLMDALMEGSTFSSTNVWTDYQTWRSANSLILSIVDPSGYEGEMALRRFTGNESLEILKVSHTDHIGTSGDDILMGGAGRDLFHSSEGIDVLKGGSGNDTYAISQGFGQVMIDDSSGDLDELSFQDGLKRSDFLMSKVGNDLVIAQNGTANFVKVSNYFTTGLIERIIFSDGEELGSRTIRDGIALHDTSLGNDVIVGSDRATTLIGLDGNDQLTGGKGNDILSGGDGDDILNGGGGDDIYIFDEGHGDDIISESSDSGIDQIWLPNSVTRDDIVISQSYDGNSLIISYKNAPGSITILNGISSLSARVEKLIFGDGDEMGFKDMFDMAITPSGSGSRIFGDFRDNRIDGGLGADYIDGREGDDVIFGYDGNDTLFGGEGRNEIHGGLGNDTITINGEDVVYGDDGNDTINVGGMGANTIYGGAGNDIINIYGLGDAIQIVDAGDGNDNIHTVRAVRADLGAGNDFIQGSAKYDEIQGGDGDDYIISSGGFDLLDGGAGNDTVEFWGESYVNVNLALGTVTYSNNSTLALTGFENVYGTWGADHVIGDDGANYMQGWAGDDILEGGGGADQLQGGEGNDTLIGGDGGDVLGGGAGNDILLGGAGYDTIIPDIGDDYIDGGLDWDTVFFFGRTQSQMVLSTTNGVTTITDTSTGPGNLGTDTLVGVESLGFSDGFINIASPIILDMDGDGVHLIDKSDSSVSFDFDGDGILDKTGWFSAGDGMLVFDENQNGIADGINEVSFTNVDGALSDLDGLRKRFDSNGDGIFSSLDDDFAKFGVWQDANGDGVSDAGEVRSLSDLGIVSINLTASAINRDWALGENIVVGAGTYETSHGTFGFQDVGFAYDSSKASSIEIPEIIEILPQWQHIALQDSLMM